MKQKRFGVGQSDEHASEGGANDLGSRRHRAEQGVGVTHLVARRDLDHQGVEGRCEEGVSHAHGAGENGERPDRRVPGEEQHGEDSLTGRAQHVSGEHDPAPSEAVGDHPATDHQHDLGDDLGGQDISQVRGAALGVEHGEDERNRRHGDAELGGQVPGEVPPDVAVPQHSTPPRQPPSAGRPGAHRAGRLDGSARCETRAPSGRWWAATPGDDARRPGSALERATGKRVTTAICRSCVDGTQLTLYGRWEVFFRRLSPGLTGPTGVGTDVGTGSEAPSHSPLADPLPGWWATVRVRR